MYKRQGQDGRTVEIQVAEGVDIRRDVANTIVSNGWGLLEMKPMRLSLEDIFLQLTTEENEGAATNNDGATPVESEPEVQKTEQGSNHD